MKFVLNDNTSNWQIKKMPDVVKWGSGGTPKATIKEYYEGGTIPWLIIGDLNDGLVTESATKITELGLENSSAKLIPKGTLLVAMYGSIGKLGITGIECCTNQAIAYAKELYGVTTEFMYYQMMLLKSELISKGKGGTQKNISQTVLNSLDVIVPPLEEQRRIVARIEELFSELDAAVATLERTKELLIRYRYSVIDTIIPLDSFISIQDCISDMGQGWSPKCINTNVTDDESWAVIKTTAVQAREFVFEENKKLPETLEPRAQHELVEGDILITRAGPKSRCGVCCMVRKTKKHLLNCDKVYRIKVNEKVVTPQYLECVLNAPKFIEEINLCKTGGNDSGLNLTQKRFLSIKVPIPSLSEQEKIVGEIESRLSVCDKIEETVNTALQEAEAMRQSILKQAFVGEL